VVLPWLVPPPGRFIAGPFVSDAIAHVPAAAASRSRVPPVDPLGQDMVQACGRARPGRDISWPQRGDTYFPHLLGEPDRIPAGLISNANVRMARVRPAGIRRMQTV
jgi:hypothetical protein